MLCRTLSPILLLRILESPIQLFRHVSEVLFGEELGAHEEAGHSGTQQHQSHCHGLTTQPVRGEGRVDKPRGGGRAILEAEHVGRKPIQLGEEGGDLVHAERSVCEESLRGGGAASERICGTAVQRVIEDCGEHGGRERIRGIAELLDRQRELGTWR